MSSDLFYIFGSGGHSKVVIEIARLNGFLVTGIFDNNPNNYLKEHCSVKILGSDDLFLKGSASIAIGDNKIRKIIHNKINFVNWRALIHPRAIVSESVEIGNGSIIMAGAIIQPGVKIGKHCIINTGACIDHDTHVGDYSHIAPNCSLAGGITIGEGSFVGIGSTIIQNIKIGEWAILGAGSVVLDDLPSFSTSIGTPARTIKFHDNIN